MRRFAALCSPLLIVVAFALHRGDFVSGRQALVLALGVEFALFSRLFWRFGAFARAYREANRSGGDTGTIFHNAIVRSNGGPFTAIFLGEALVWLSLWRFARGGWKQRDGDFSYHRKSPLSGLVFVTLLTAPAELLVIELVVPWRSAKLILFVIALYSLLWILGYAASQITSPHRVTADELLIRKGFLATARIPLAGIEKIEITHEPLPPAAERWGAAILEGVAFFAIAGKADVRVRSRDPILVRHLIVDSAPVHITRFAVDEPERFKRVVLETLRSSAPQTNEGHLPTGASLGGF